MLEDPQPFRMYATGTSLGRGLPPESVLIVALNVLVDEPFDVTFVEV
jgi:hypothetical protein